MLRETLYLLMMGLPAHYGDPEEPDARSTRLRVIAEAVADVAEQATCSAAYKKESCVPLWPGASLDLGVLLVTQAYEESRLAKNVHEGQCRAYECDPIRVGFSGEIRHRARSLWQIHHIRPVEDEWDHMVGADYESTRFAAWAATKILSRGYRNCGTLSGAISQYAGVGTCGWSQSKKRGKLVLKLRDRARNIEQKWLREQGLDRSASNN